MALTNKQKEQIIQNKKLRAASSRRVATKIIAVLVLAALLVTGGTWGVVSLIDANSMKVTISKGAEGLSLSNYSDFSDATTNLKIGGPETIDATTYTNFEFDKKILGFEGAHHGKNYIGFSFFLKNVSSTKYVKFLKAEVLKNCSKGVEKALRVMIIESTIDGTIKNINIYAEKDMNDQFEYVAYDTDQLNHNALTLKELNMNKELLTSNETRPFIGQRIEDEEDLKYYIGYDDSGELAPNEIRKYTALLWIEGTDYECKNDIVSGSCQIDIEFSVIEYGDIVNY